MAVTSPTPERLALQQALSTCRGHRDGLVDALTDMPQPPADVGALAHLTRDDRRVLDQFAYRYTRLQDDMGNRLLPAILRALGEDIAVMSTIDRLARLEQLGWIPSADEWLELRRLRNEFSHEYPQAPEERLERLRLAFAAARRLLAMLADIEQRVHARWG
jgi:hypothetical protein